MMRRRMFRRGTRFRRRGPETYTVLQCRSTRNVFTNMPCGGALLDAIPILLPVMNPSAGDTTAPAVVGQKANVLAGLKFSAEHMTDPGTWIDEAECTLADPCPSLAAFIMTIWEAIVVLPLAQATKNVPAYIPDFTQPASQGADIADRVLWKRLTHMPMWGLQTTSSVPQLQTTVRDTDHGNQVVKSKVRIDDRHGLFYCRSMVHDIVVLAGFSQIPVQLDLWAKVFYKSTFR